MQTATMAHRTRPPSCSTETSADSESAAIAPAAAANAAVAVAAERIRLAHDIGAVVRQSVTRMAEVADHAHQARVADLPPALSRQARESG
jgi:hypothetical protein